MCTGGSPRYFSLARTSPLLLFLRQPALSTGKPARDKDSGEAPMTTLGNALYVIGCVAAVPFLALAIYSVATLAGYFGGTTAPLETQIFAERMTASAVISWLGGRLARHILAGT